MVRTASGTPRTRTVWLVVAAVLHVAVLPFYAASGLLAPGWAVVLLLVLWALLAGVLVLVARRRGAQALLVPAAALAVWFLALTAGEQLLGWTG